MSILIFKDLLKNLTAKIIKHNIKNDADLYYENAICFTWKNHVERNDHVHSYDILRGYSIDCKNWGILQENYCRQILSQHDRNMDSNMSSDSNPISS